MKKLNEMFSAMKTTVLSMDKKNKTILGIVAVALVGAITFGGYQLSTIGKTVDSDVKQTEKIKKTEDSKKDSSTDKKEDSKKAETKKEKEASEKKKGSEKSEKSEKTEKSTSTKKGTANTEKTESLNTGNASSNKINSSNSGNTSSNSTSNKQEAAKPAPKPEPTPEPAPQPTGPTEAELNALNEAEKQKVISQAQQNPGGMFDSMDAAAAWGYAQRRDESSPYFGKMFNAVGVGVGDETYGYIVVFN